MGAAASSERAVGPRTRVLQLAPSRSVPMVRWQRTLLPGERNRSLADLARKKPAGLVLKAPFPAIETLVARHGQPAERVPDERTIPRGATRGLADPGDGTHAARRGASTPKMNRTENRADNATHESFGGARHV